MELVVFIFGFLLCMWLLSVSAGYFYHTVNTFKEGNTKYISANEFIERFREFDPVIISMEGLEILLLQTELLDDEHDSYVYCSLTVGTYRIGKVHYILSPIGYWQVDSYLRTKYNTLKTNNRFYKNNREQLEEIEKGPFFTTEEVKERLRTKFPFLKDLR